MTRELISLAVLALLYLHSSAATIITSTPPHANISIDGKPVYLTTPAKIEGVPTGIHLVRIQHGNKIYEEKMLFSEASSIQTHIDLKQARNRIRIEDKDTIKSEVSFSTRIQKYKDRNLANALPYENSKKNISILPFKENFKKEKFYPAAIGLLSAGILYSLAGYSDLRASEEYDNYNTSSTTTFTKDFRKNSTGYIERGKRFSNFGDTALLLSSIFAGIAFIDWRF